MATTSALPPLSRPTPGLGIKRRSLIAPKKAPTLNVSTTALTPAGINALFLPLAPASTAPTPEEQVRNELKAKIDTIFREQPNTQLKEAAFEALFAEMNTTTIPPQTQTNLGEIFVAVVLSPYQNPQKTEILNFLLKKYAAQQTSASQNNFLTGFFQKFIKHGCETSKDIFALLNPPLNFQGFNLDLFWILSIRTQAFSDPNFQPFTAPWFTKLLQIMSLESINKLFEELSTNYQTARARFQTPAPVLSVPAATTTVTRPSPAAKEYFLGYYAGIALINKPITDIESSLTNILEDIAQRESFLTGLAQGLIDSMQKIDATNAATLFKFFNTPILPRLVFIRLMKLADTNNDFLIQLASLNPKILTLYFDNQELSQAECAIVPQDKFDFIAFKLLSYIHPVPYTQIAAEFSLPHPAVLQAEQNFLLQQLSESLKVKGFSASREQLTKLKTDLNKLKGEGSLLTIDPIIVIINAKLMALTKPGVVNPAENAAVKNLRKKLFAPDIAALQSFTNSKGALYSLNLYLSNCHEKGIEINFEDLHTILGNWKTFIGTSGKDISKRKKALIEALDNKIFNAAKSEHTDLCQKARFHAARIALLQKRIDALNIKTPSEINSKKIHFSSEEQNHIQDLIISFKAAVTENQPFAASSVLIDFINKAKEKTYLQQQLLLAIDAKLKALKTTADNILARLNTQLISQQRADQEIKELKPLLENLLTNLALLSNSVKPENTALLININAKIQSLASIMPEQCTKFQSYVSAVSAKKADPPNPEEPGQKLLGFIDQSKTNTSVQQQILLAINLTLAGLLKNAEATPPTAISKPDIKNLLANLALMLDSIKPENRPLLKNIFDQLKSTDTKINEPAFSDEMKPNLDKVTAFFAKKSDNYFNAYLEETANWVKFLKMQPTSVPTLSSAIRKLETALKAFSENPITIKVIKDPPDPIEEDYTTFHLAFLTVIKEHNATINACSSAIEPRTLLLDTTEREFLPPPAPAAATTTSASMPAPATLLSVPVATSATVTSSTAVALAPTTVANLETQFNTILSEDKLLSILNDDDLTEKALKLFTRLQDCKKNQNNQIAYNYLKYDLDEFTKTIKPSELNLEKILNNWIGNNIISITKLKENRQIYSTLIFYAAKNYIDLYTISDEDPGKKSAKQLLDNLFTLPDFNNAYKCSCLEQVYANALASQDPRQTSNLWLINPPSTESESAAKFAFFKTILTEYLNKMLEASDPNIDPIMFNPQMADRMLALLPPNPQPPGDQIYIRIQDPSSGNIKIHKANGESALVKMLTENVVNPDLMLEARHQRVLINLLNYFLGKNTGEIPNLAYIIDKLLDALLPKMELQPNPVPSLNITAYEKIKMPVDPQVKTSMQTYAAKLTTSAKKINFDSNGILYLMEVTI
ncbi:MAG: hypothetical protein WC860_07155 [Candidatus Margulisiibacteriota bacterium]|jgi:hypothetical protein